jgi:hypothetical protein
VASAAGTSATFTTGTPSATTLNNEWTYETMLFVATSSSTPITLQVSLGANYIGLDNVSVDLSGDTPASYKLR